MFLVAAGILVYHFYDSRRPMYIPEEAVREPRPQSQPIEEPPEPEPDPPQQYVYYVSEPPPEQEYVPASTRELLPRIVALREEYDNTDIVGFVEIPNTPIAYPVVQTGNNVFYLYHDIHFNSSRSGSIFLDYENDLGALADDNTLIYGHNMRNGSKFHALRYFHREDYFRARPYILLDTPYEETVWDIFSFFHTTTAFCYLTTNFHCRDEFFEFILYLQASSAHSTDIVLVPEDQILILSTCGVTGGPNRYIAIARLRRS